MKKSFLLLIPLALLNSVQAQSSPEWAINFGGSSTIRAHAMAVDASNDIYTTGYINSTTDMDPGPDVAYIIPQGDGIFISKTDASGNFLWAKALSANTNAGNEATISTDASGAVYITAAFSGSCDFDPGPGVFNLVSHADYDLFILKLDAAGNFVWARNFGSDQSIGMHTAALATDPAGNIYLTGNLNASFDPNATFDLDPGNGVFALNPGSGCCFILQLDVQGNFSWANKFGENTTQISSIAAGNNGNLYLTGDFRETIDIDPGTGEFLLSAGAYTEVFVVRLDASGQLIWGQSFGTASNDFAYQISLDATHAVYVTGIFAGKLLSEPGGERLAYIRKFDPEGNPAWMKRLSASFQHNFPGTGFHPMHVDPTTGQVYLAGSFSSTGDFNPGAGEFTLMPTHPNWPNSLLIQLDAAGEFVSVQSLEPLVPLLAIDGGSDGQLCVLSAFSGVIDVDQGPGVYALDAGDVPDVAVLKLSTATTPNSPAEAYTIYPNPTENLLQVSIPKDLLLPGITIDVYNLLGVLVDRQTTYSELNTVDLTGYSNGFYTVKISVHGLLLHAEKIVKM
jgi:hypothetical protein